MSCIQAGCILEPGEGVVVLQRLAQRVDALGGAGAITILVNAADLVVVEAASETKRRCYWLLTTFALKQPCKVQWAVRVT